MIFLHKYNKTTFIAVMLSQFLEVGFWSISRTIRYFRNMLLWWGNKIRIDLGLRAKKWLRSCCCPYKGECEDKNALNEIMEKYLWNNMENIGKYSSINWVPKKLKIDKMISHPKQYVIFVSRPIVVLYRLHKSSLRLNYAII